MNFLNTIFNVIFPVHCISCGKTGFELCAECLSDSPATESESADWIFPLFDYQHIPIKKSIRLFKYKNKKKFAVIFADVLYGKIIEELSELSIMNNFREPLLVPIPLSSKRYKERGYNQAELVCEELIKLDQKQFPHLRHGVNGGIIAPNKNFTLAKDVLIKIKETEHQAKISDRKIRLKNLFGSFAIKNLEVIKGRNIILIDDVLTTGATLNEAKKILKQSGAKKVIAFTVAH